MILGDDACNDHLVANNTSLIIFLFLFYVLETFLSSEEEIKYLLGIIEYEKGMLLLEITEQALTVALRR